MTFHQAAVCKGRTCGPTGSSYPLYIQSWTRFFDADWTEGLHGVAFDTSGIYHSADVATPAGGAVHAPRRAPPVAQSPLLQPAPRSDRAGAARLGRELYGLDAAASTLPSERDQNFL